MSAGRRPAEPGSSGEPSERLAEVMAWHGMARYADPDDLAVYVRPPRTDDPGEPPEPREPPVSR